jgi:hypothetical protein
MARVPTTHYFKVGDDLPVFTTTLLNSAGDPVALDEDDDVFFKLSGITNNVRLSGDADVVVASGGSIAYAVATGDNIPEGDYWAEWMVRHDDGRESTYPNDGYDLVKVRDRL